MESVEGGITPLVVLWCRGREPGLARETRPAGLALGKGFVLAMVGDAVETCLVLALLLLLLWFTLGLTAGDFIRWVLLEAVVCV